MVEQPVERGEILVNDLRPALTDQADRLAKVFADVVASGRLVHGPQHQSFEEELAAVLRVNDVVGVANGTDALELAFRAAAPTGRSVVVTAANAGGYASVAAMRAGLRVRYCDVDANTHCLDPDALRTVMSDDVAVVVVTHLYGRMAPVEECLSIADSWGAVVVEDCAQAIGAELNGRGAGSFGGAAAFSFYPTKNLGALGDGGAVATNDEAVAIRLRQLRQYGWTGKYVVTEEGGRNSRLDEIQAAVLRMRLPDLAGWNARRREIITAYEIAASDRLRVLPARGPSHVGHLAVVEADDPNDLRGYLGVRGIGTAVHYPVPDYRQPALARMVPEGSAIALETTERLCRRIVTLPCFPELTDHEVERICDALRAY